MKLDLDTERRQRLAKEEDARSRERLARNETARRCKSAHAGAEASERSAELRCPCRPPVPHGALRLWGTSAALLLCLARTRESGRMEEAMAAVEKRLEMLFQAGPRLRISFTSTSRKKTAPQDLDQGIQKRKARTRMSSASQTTSEHLLLKTLVCEVSTLCFSCSHDRLRG